MTNSCRVMVLPGLAASDRSTVVLRAALGARGHRVHGWNLGINEGPTAKTLSLVQERAQELAAREGAAISLVGWSMGGTISHWLAQNYPRLVAKVITLGSPLRGDGGPPRLGVPTTSIYSRRDRIVPWQASLIDDKAAHHENIEARAGHLAFGFDPAVLYAVNDRLMQPIGGWKPFTAPPWLALAFPNRSTST